jgi:hypothetical protein
MTRVASGVSLLIFGLLLISCSSSTSSKNSMSSNEFATTTSTFPLRCTRAPQWELNKISSGMKSPDAEFDPVAALVLTEPNEYTSNDFDLVIAARLADSTDTRFGLWAESNNTVIALNPAALEIAPWGSIPGFDQIRTELLGTEAARIAEACAFSMNEEFLRTNQQMGR